VNADELRRAAIACGIDDDDEPPRPKLRVTAEPVVAVAPADPSVPGERDAKGRFVAGVWRGGPGRPSRPDPYAIACEGAAKDGTDLRARLWSVLKRMIEQAEGGDTHAANLVMKHLCSNDAVAVAFAAELTGTDRITRLQALLVRAAARLAGGEDHEDE
jgi:hypothetical protein